MEAEGRELAYRRKASMRGKNRKVRIEDVYRMDNLVLADKAARKGKKNHKGVRLFDADPDGNLLALQSMLVARTYRTSPGHECVRLCPCGKERVLHKLPYYPDHIEHHALMQVIFPIMLRSYYHDSYASIKGKGMHYAARRTMRYIDEHRSAGRIYYAKIDFVKFYHNIDQRKAYDCLCRKFGDAGIRYLIWEVLTACEKGLGIGLYPIQPIANYYTGRLCRLLVERHDVRVEIYCDDIVIMGVSKSEVWGAVNTVREYARDVMCQPLHDGVGVQVIDERHGLDFVGYRFFMGHTLLRKRMKEKFKRRMARLTDPARRYEVATSYKGWLMHCEGYNLWCSVMGMKSFKELEVPRFDRVDADGRRMLEGTKVSASMVTGREVEFTDVELGVKSRYEKPAAVVQVRENGRYYKFFTCNGQLIQTLGYCKENGMFPFRGTLVNKAGSGMPNYEIQ